tara:strand:- start:31191 stop:32957 length:1767 start_codon:yes stop_codon:yes gene_type:complete
MKIFKLENKTSWFLLIFGIFITQNWINFFYSAPTNSDFDKYYDYINYFMGLDVVIDYGQGTFYYYLVTIFFLRKIELVDESNIDILLSYSVQQVNLIFYLIGILGAFRLLNLKKFEKKEILLSLIILNIFPQTIYMRSVMKPEIVAFALIFWIIYFLEQFLKSKDLNNLIFLIPFMVLLINTKASIAGMVIVYLLVFYFKIFGKIEIKKTVFLILLTLTCQLAIQYENYNITNLSPFERVYDEEYDYQARASSIFRFNLSDLITDPFFTYNYEENFYSIHANSVINITLLDTFGDHFKQLFDSRPSYFSKYRKALFVNDSEVLITSMREINYEGPLSNRLSSNLDYFRKIIPVIFSFFFYFGILYYASKSKESRKFYLAPFVGIFILYINSLGIPSNNFNPFKGDTYKPFYYGFLLSIAFVYLLAELFKKINVFKILFIFIFIFSMIFVSGHPKSNSQNLSEHIVVMNEYSNFCEINNLLFLENKLISSIHKSGNINGYKSDCSGFSTHKYIQASNNSTNNNIYDQCLETSYKLNTNFSNTKECRIIAIDIVTSEQINRNTPPYFSILLALGCIVIIFKDKNNMFKKK